MKFPRLFFILYLATCVLSFSIRGGFVRMWLWYTNRLSLLAVSRGAKNIQLLVPDFKKAQGDFNEFIRAISENKDAPNILNPPTLWPPVDETARRLEDLKLNGAYFNNLIVPKSGKWENMMKKIEESNKRAIAALDPTKPEEKRLLEQLNTALKGVLDTRQADEDKHLKDWLQDRATTEKKEIKWKMKPVTRAGQVFELLGIPGTAHLTSGGNTAEMKKLKSWIKKEKEYRNYAKGTRKRHINTLNQYREVWKAQNGGNACPRR
ncbi:hypothetical protein BDV12DRAFT_192394 [Aspergillus spectabilis]